MSENECTCVRTTLESDTMASRADPKMFVDDRSIDHADIDTVSSPGFTVALARQLVADDRDRVLKQTCKLDQLVRQLSAGEVSHLRGTWGPLCPP